MSQATYSADNGANVFESGRGRYAAEPTFDVGPGLTCAIAMRLLRAEGSKMPSVDAIYLRPDGLEFVITGKDPSPDMYEACADVACLIQSAVDPSGASYVEGGWHRDHPPIEGWLVAYARER